MKLIEIEDMWIDPSKVEAVYQEEDMGIVSIKIVFSGGTFTLCEGRKPLDLIIKKINNYRKERLV